MKQPRERWYDCREGMRSWWNIYRRWMNCFMKQVPWRNETAQRKDDMIAVREWYGHEISSAVNEVFFWNRCRREMKETQGKDEIITGQNETERDDELAVREWSEYWNIRRDHWIIKWNKYRAEWNRARWWACREGMKWIMKYRSRQMKYYMK